METNSRSLRTILFTHLGLGIILWVLLDAIACYFTALYFTNLVYDKWLLDSTSSLVKAVHVDNNTIQFDLQREAIDMFRFDENDKTYFKISSKRRGYIAGDSGLIDSEYTNEEPQLTYSYFSGSKIRQATIHQNFQNIDDTAIVTVAETLIKRAKLTDEILIAMIAPQLALLIGALFISWLSIAKGIKPLTDLASAIESLDQHNLSPVSLDGLPHELRILSTRINDLLQKIRNTLESQKHFISDAAHQLRTPLAAILLHAEQAEMAQSSIEQASSLKSLHNSVKRAARLSQQLLSLAKSEHNSAALEEFSLFNLSSLARQTAEDWIHLALDRGIDFGLNVTDQNVLIYGNERLIGEMLSNLIDNALQYVGLNGTVTVKVQYVNDLPCLSVEDNGPGIPHSERDRIFERFYRIPGTHHDGCGLGLAIVEEIATVHDARIFVSSGLNGNGSIFSIYFKHPSVNNSGAYQ